jgi:hypothetical protein
VHDGGVQLLARTHSWFAANAARLTIDASVAELEAMYAETVGRGARHANGHAIAPPPPIAIDPIGALGADDRRRP